MAVYSLCVCLQCFSESKPDLITAIVQPPEEVTVKGVQLVHCAYKYREIADCVLVSEDNDIKTLQSLLR